MAKYILDYTDNLPGKKAKAQHLEDEYAEIDDIQDIQEDPYLDTEDDAVENEDRLIKYHTKDDSDDSIRYYLEEISRYKLLTADEEKELSKEIQAGSEKALHQLINANLRLVVKIAKQYVSNDYPLIDIIQDGNLGLIRACEKFDHRKNVRFSTYASWWIKQTIVRSLSIRKRMIRIPHRKEEKYRKIKKTIDAYTQKFKSEPTNDEVSELTGIPVKEVEDIQATMVNVVSYESTLADDENITLLNTLSDSKEKPDETLFDEQLQEETRRLLDSLQPKEKEVIIRRFGFDTGERFTLKAMGNNLGISAETIRQIEIKALRKLRVNFKHMRDYLN